MGMTFDGCADSSTAEKLSVVHGHVSRLVEALASERDEELRQEIEKTTFRTLDEDDVEFDMPDDSHATLQKHSGKRRFPLTQPRAVLSKCSQPPPKARRKNNDDEKHDDELCMDMDE